MIRWQSSCNLISCSHRRLKLQEVKSTHLSLYQPYANRSCIHRLNNKDLYLMLGHHYFYVAQIKLERSKYYGHSFFSCNLYFSYPKKMPNSWLFAHIFFIIFFLLCELLFRASSFDNLFKSSFKSVFDFVYSCLKQLSGTAKYYLSQRCYSLTLLGRNVWFKVSSRRE